MYPHHTPVSWLDVFVGEHVGDFCYWTCCKFWKHTVEHNLEQVQIHTAGNVREDLEGKWNRKELKNNAVLEFLHFFLVLKRSSTGAVKDLWFSSLVNSKDSLKWQLHAYIIQSVMLFNDKISMLLLYVL